MEAALVILRGLLTSRYIMLFLVISVAIFAAFNTGIAGYKRYHVDAALNIVSISSPDIVMVTRIWPEPGTTFNTGDVLRLYRAVAPVVEDSVEGFGGFGADLAAACIGKDRLFYYNNTEESGAYRGPSVVSVYVLYCDSLSGLLRLAGSGAPDGVEAVLVYNASLASEPAAEALNMFREYLVTSNISYIDVTSLDVSIVLVYLLTSNYTLFVDVLEEFDYITSNGTFPVSTLYGSVSLVSFTEITSPGVLGRAGSIRELADTIEDFRREYGASLLRLRESRPELFAGSVEWPWTPPNSSTVYVNPRTGAVEERENIVRFKTVLDPMASPFLRFIDSYDRYGERFLMDNPGIVFTTVVPYIVVLWLLVDVLSGGVVGPLEEFARERGLAGRFSLQLWGVLVLLYIAVVTALSYATGTSGGLVLALLFPAMLLYRRRMHGGERLSAVFVVLSLLYIVPGGVFLAIHLYSSLGLLDADLWRVFDGVGSLFMDRLLLGFLHGLVPLFLIVYVVLGEQVYSELHWAVQRRLEHRAADKAVAAIDIEDPAIRVGRVAIAYFLALLIVSRLYPEVMAGVVAGAAGAAGRLHYMVAFQSVFLDISVRVGLAALAAGLAGLFYGYWRHLSLLLEFYSARGLRAERGAVARPLLYIAATIGVEALVVSLLLLMLAVASTQRLA